MASSVHSLQVSDVTTDGLYKKDRKESNLSSASSSRSSRSPRSPRWMLEENYIQVARAEQQRALPKGFDSTQPGSVEEIVDERVNSAVNEWIAEKHPPVTLNPLVKVDALKGSRKPKALWVGLQWELKPAALQLNLRMQIFAFCLDGGGKCNLAEDVIHLGNPKGREDCVEHTAGSGRKGDLETIRLNLYPLQVLGIKSVLLVCHLTSAQHAPQRMQAALAMIRCAVYDKFGDRYRTSCQLAVAGPILANTTGIELIRLTQDGSTWMVTAPLKQHAGPLKGLFQDLRPVSLCAMLKRKDTFPLEGVLSSERLYLEFFCYSAMAGNGLDILVAGLDAKGELAMQPVTSGGPPVPGLAPCRPDPGKSRITMEVVLGLVPANVVTLACIGCLNPLALVRGHSFLQVLHAGVRLYTKQGDVDVVAMGHDLAPELTRETAVEFCRLQRGSNGKWKSAVATSDGMMLGREELLQALTTGQWLVKPEAISVKPGERVNVTKACPGLRVAQFGLTWGSLEGQKVQMSPLALCLGPNEKLNHSQDCVGGRNKKSSDGAVTLSRESPDDRGDGPEEVVTIQLAGVKPPVEHVVLALMLHTRDPSTAQPHELRNLQSLTAQLSDGADRRCVFRLPVSLAQWAGQQALAVGTLTRWLDGTWYLLAKADPLPGNVSAVLLQYHHGLLKNGQQQALPDKCGRLAFGFGWDSPSHAPHVDLDVVVFGLDDAGKAVADDYVISDHNVRSADKAVRLAGEKKEDDETVEVYLKALAAGIRELVFYTLVDTQQDAAGTFAAIASAYLSLTDAGSQGAELFRLQLEGASDGDTCLEVGRLRKQDNGKWVFASVLAGSKASITDLCKVHGASAGAASPEVHRHRHRSR
eukprot:EG_transcript_2544